MIIKILGLVLFLLGIILIFSIIQDNRKNPINIDVKDKVILSKYNKTRKILNLVEALSYTLMGLLLIFDIVSGEYFGCIVFAFFVLNKIVEYIPNKKHQKIN